MSLAFSRQDGHYLISSRSVVHTVARENYTRGVHAFLMDLVTGVDVAFSKRRLVLAGHSLGGNVA